MPVFVHPWAWLLTLPALWLLLRARRPRPRQTAVVANLFLWNTRAPQASSASITDRPLPPWRVWLQAAVLILVAGAASMPSIAPGDADEALILDGSSSMAAREDGLTRMDLAQQNARDWLAGVPARRQIYVVVAETRARELGAFRGSDAALTTALSGVRVSTGTADFAAAIATARQHTTGRITVISDLPAPATTDDIVWRRVGQPVDNAAVTAVVSDGDTTLVEVANFGRTPLHATLAVSAGAAWSRALLLAPSEHRAIALRIPRAGAALSARLQVDARDAARNALDSDDQRAAEQSQTARLRVLLITPSSPTLEAALRAIPDVDLQIAAGLPTRPHDVADVVICDRCAVPAPPPSLWIPSPGASTAGEDGFVVQHPDHPLLDAVDLSDLRVAPTRITTPVAQDMAPLATVGGSPVIMVGEADGTRRALLAIDLEHSSLPLTSAFPILIYNAVQWLGQRPTAQLTGSRLQALSESNLLSPEPPRIDGGTVSTPRAEPRPWWPALAIMALALALIEMALRQHRVALRLAAAIVLLAAIMKLPAPWSAERFIVFALDTSASVAGLRRASTARVDAELNALQSGDHAAIVAFGSGAHPLRGQTSGMSVATLLPEPASSSDIAAGLRSARGQFPADVDKRMVLISDGQATTGDAMSEAAAAARDGIAIDVIPLRTSRQPLVASLEAPTEVRAGSPVAITAHVKGAEGDRVTVRFSRDGSDIDTRAVRIDASGVAVTTATDVVTRPGLSFYRAAIIDESLGIVLSEQGAAVTVSGRGRALVITNRPGRFSTLARGGSLDLKDASVAALPSSRIALAPFSAVVLDGISPASLSLPQQRALADAATLDGLGILLSGSQSALEASGFAPSPLVDLLPLDFTQLPRPPSRSAALALLVDLSGSMATASDGVTKIDAARDAIRRALAVVPATDAVEVIGFSTSPTVIVDAKDPRSGDSLASRLASLRPNGGTAIGPAVTQAVAWLKAADAPRRRLLLVSDGRTTADDASAVRAAVASQGIEVSVVTIGADAERQWLAELAAATGGRAYFPDAVVNLARDVAREAARGASEREVTGRTRVRAGVHPLAPVVAAPELGGYVAARLRAGAASAWLSPSDDTILAAWSQGLGRVAALATDLDGAWGAPLLSWPERSTYWIRLLSWVSRSGDSSRVDAELASTSSGPRLVVDVGESSPQESLAAVTAAIVTPSGRTLTLPLHPVTRTRYEAALDLSETGDYRANITVTASAAEPERRSMHGWHWRGDVEARSVGTNEALLAEIARVSGGRLLPPLPGAWTIAEATSALPRRRSSAPLTVWLLALGGAILTIDYLRALRRLEKS